MKQSTHITDLITAIRGTATGDDAQRATTAEFDGVICFGGEDWWYHNRGHYDMQMMREMSSRFPVLYVNSIGMRVPRPAEGRMFLTRVGRKLRSLRRGLVHQQGGMSILSPPALPGARGIRLSHSLVVRFVRRAALERGITRPLVWIACPTAADLVAPLNPSATIYQRTDRYESFEGVDADRIRALDRRLKEESDLTLFCSRHLFDLESRDCRCAEHVDHGIDTARFAAANASEDSTPADVAGLPRPRIGFIGGIDRHTFDAALFEDVARRMPDCRFVMIGTSSLTTDASSLPNVTWLGQRPFEDVPHYMAACDVLIMPWRRSSWIEACNPVKLKEYLASGRPIVSTPFPELSAYDGLVRVAADAEAFAGAIRAAIAEPGDPHARRERVSNCTWTDQSRRVLDRLSGRLRGASSAGHVTPRSIRLNRSAATPLDDHVSPVIGRIGIEDDASPCTIDLATCILLAGGLRPSALIAESGRSVLDQPLTHDRTVGSAWIDRLCSLTELTRRPPAIRIVHDSRMPPPWPLASPIGDLIIEREPRAALRGPAGVLHDLCRELPPESQVFVAEAARYVGVSLLPLLREHAERRADITVAANPDGSPAGIYLLRRRVLDLISPVGFVDFKEQLIPRAIEAGMNLRVHHLAAPGALPIRTTAGLQAASEQFVISAVAEHGLVREHVPDQREDLADEQIGVEDADGAFVPYTFGVSTTPSARARGRP